MESTLVGDRDTLPAAGQVCADLAVDHERMAHRFHAPIRLAGQRYDPVTEDLATELSAFHEKAAWMLRTLSKRKCPSA